MEEQYEEIDKIINSALKTFNGVIINNQDVYRLIAVIALERGYAAGYEIGYDDGSAIGFFEASDKLD